MDFFFRLPMPWLLYTLVFGKPVPVTSAGMVCSITLLFCMLMLVFFSILSFNWKMTKGKNLKTSNPPHKIILKNYLGKRPVQQFLLPCVFKYETQFYHFFYFFLIFSTYLESKLKSSLISYIPKNEIYISFYRHPWCLL